MWVFGMTTPEMEGFIREYLDEFLDVLLAAYGMTVDEIIRNQFHEEAIAYLQEHEEWEAC